MQARFDLHPLAVEDAAHAHQRPKIEDYRGRRCFVVLRTARYDDAREEVQFGEIHIFVGPSYVVIVRHGEASDLRGARQRLEDHPELLALGPSSSSGPCSTRSSTTTSPWSRDWRTTSTRSRSAVFGDQGDQSRARLLPAARGHGVLRALIRCFSRSRRSSAARSPRCRTRCAPLPPRRRRPRQRVDEESRSQRDLLTAVLQANLSVIAVARTRSSRRCRRGRRSSPCPRSSPASTA